VFFFFGRDAKKWVFGYLKRTKSVTLPKTQKVSPN